MKLLVLYNPHSGRRRIQRAWDAVQKTFSRSHDIHRIDLSEHSLPKPNDIRSFDALIIIGGDGTIRSVVETIHKHALRIPIGIVPVGSANVLAKSLRIPHATKRALNLIEQGKTMAIDLGILSNGQYVLSAFALGYLSDRVLAASHVMKRRFGFSGYMLSFVRKTTLPLHTFTLSVDGETRTVAGHSLFIVNAASIFRVHSRRMVDLRDGQFELVVTTNKNFISLPALAYDFFLRTSDPRHFVLLRGKKFTLSITPAMTAQIDGEPFNDHGTVTLTVEPQKQEFFVA